LRGYIEGGHLYELKKMCELIDYYSINKDRDILLITALKSNNVECYSYLNKLLSFTKEEIDNRIALNLETMSETIWYILINDTTKKLWKKVFDALMSKNDFEGLLKITRRFNPELMFSCYLIEKMSINKDMYNEPYYNWLVNNANI
jgi:hypothetical protein